MYQNGYLNVSNCTINHTRENLEIAEIHLMQFVLLIVSKLYKIVLIQFILV